MKVEAIFGPPGTGKTRTLVGIAKQEADAGSRGVLYLSYTKAAAEEAVSRIRESTIKPSTLHSFAFNATGMNRASVVDSRKLADFGKESGIPFKGSERGSDELQEGDEYATVLEYANNKIIDPMGAYDLFGRPGTQHRFQIFLTSYKQWKETYGYMDFDDMLMNYTRSTATTRAAEVVILDEAQDCTPMQWLAFIKIVENAKRVYIAGDDDQAIYEWSGADPHGMANFAEVNDGKVTILDRSFRVPRSVHGLAHSRILKDIDKRVDKRFKPRDAEGKVTFMGDFWNVDMIDVANNGGAMVLARDRFRLEEIKKDLNRQMIPYDVMGGNSPWTNRIAQAIRKGEKVDIPLWWRDFYNQADLNEPINIVLSTIHQAKGREANRVIVDLQMTGKVMADIDRNPDAERRVWYVAVTRSADELILCGGNPLL